jgi:hypothetical protein
MPTPPGVERAGRCRRWPTSLISNSSRRSLAPGAR